MPNFILNLLKNHALVALLLLSCASNAGAQSPELRYQLGRRLTRFEHKWQTADAAQRAHSTPKMMAAVNSFFSLQLDDAIVKLDQAWLTVEGGGQEENPERISDAGWFLNVGPLLRDSNSHSLDLTLEHQPKTSKLPTQGTSCDLSVAIANAKSVEIAERKWPSVSNKDTWKWGIEPLPQGDYRVSSRLHRGEIETDVIANRFSVISNLEMRMERVRTMAMGRRPAPTDTKGLTIQSLAKTILGGHEGRPSESDIPFATLFSDLDFLASESSTVRELIASRPEQSIWLQLGKVKSKQHVRLQVSTRSKGSPLVVAFHGAGGSENMFFESYGAGGLIELCRQRSWSVVSPRQSLLGLGMDLDKMLDELGSHLDFDPKRVLVIGHSMGAAQAVSQVSKYPTRVRAVAAIGGGGMPTKSDDLITVPFFIAAGEKDFGLQRARMLSNTLQAYGAKVDFREVKDVEHMVIVQATLDDTIAFFEQHLK